MQEPRLDCPCRGQGTPGSEIPFSLQTKGLGFVNLFLGFYSFSVNSLFFFFLTSFLVKLLLQNVTLVSNELSTEGPDKN